MSQQNPQQLGAVITDPTVRKVIYTAYVVATFLAGAVAVGFLAATGQLPPAMATVNAVLAFVGVPVGGLAAVNARPAA